MAGSTLGTIWKITTWGESHGAGVGVVIDGCPAGLPLTEEDVQSYLDRRKPGQSRFTTQRQEGDNVEILSGVFEGCTTGTPIAMFVKNQDQRSKITAILWNFTALDTQTTLLIRNTVFGIIEAAAGLLEGKPLEE